VASPRIGFTQNLRRNNKSEPQFCRFLGAFWKKFSPFSFWGIFIISKLYEKSMTVSSVPREIRANYVGMADW
jgi:hypothetical protein